MADTRRPPSSDKGSASPTTATARRQADRGVNQNLEPEEVRDDDADSAFDSESLLSTESLTPSILEYRQLHGRTYASSKTGDYWGPNDERQSEGLDLIHNALTILLGDK